MIIKAFIGVVLLFSAPFSFFCISRTEQGNTRKAYVFCAAVTATEALIIILLASSI